MIAPGEAGSLLLVAIVDFAPTHPAEGKRYEDAVLALLPRHGGALEQRLPSTDATSEVHVIRFDSRAGYESFMQDPDRQSLRTTLGDAAPTTRVIEVADPRPHAA
ncbi:hypothetical protein JIG36_49095 [Actinoplanes sp. LDG1-06]|uniref:ABM domain-containing protein n=1 Tax=Paractinoplanes ovalisporus TaxID=2810368 RepID=A0ABS2AWC9_9ACTN|nr:hypothetical protein [Actinoplanes ovalisporus]MBM2623479.1 hypothetical protein [Actinoplanes ovalisporus]